MNPDQPSTWPHYVAKTDAQAAAISAMHYAFDLEIVSPDGEERVFAIRCDDVTWPVLQRYIAVFSACMEFVRLVTLRGIVTSKGLRVDPELDHGVARLTRLIRSQPDVRKTLREALEDSLCSLSKMGFLVEHPERSSN